MVGEGKLVRPVLGALVAVLCALLLASCQSGSMSGMERSCRSSGGGFATERVECSGRVGSLSGTTNLGVIAGDEDLDGEYLLEATLEVGNGTVRARVADAEGEVSPGNPLELSALVQPDEDEDVDVELEVVGEERAEDLSFEAALTLQD